MPFIYNRLSSYFFGAVLGLSFSAQSIMAVFKVNISISLYLLILIVGILRLPKSRNVYRGRGNLLLGLVSMFFILYACLVTMLSDGAQIFGVFELLIFIFLFYCAQVVDCLVLKSLFVVVMIVGFIQTIYILVDRAGLYASAEFYHINYLLLSLVPGLFTCLSYIRLFYSRSLERFFYMLMMVLGVCGLVEVQSRAVAIFCFTFIALFPFFVVEQVRRYLFVLVVAGVGAYFSLFTFFQSSPLYKRLDYMYNHIGDESRISTYEVFFEHVSEFSIYGYGAKLTSQKIYGEHRDAYPHNLFLEFWSDFGLVGLFYSLMLVACCCYRILLAEASGYYYCIVLFLFLFYLMNFMKSFSIYDAPVLFLSLGLALGISNMSAYKRREKGV